MGNRSYKEAGRGAVRCGGGGPRSLGRWRGVGVGGPRGERNDRLWRADSGRGGRGGAVRCGGGFCLPGASGVCRVRRGAAWVGRRAAGGKGWVMARARAGAPHRTAPRRAARAVVATTASAAGRAGAAWPRGRVTSSVAFPSAEAASVSFPFLKTKSRIPSSRFQQRRADCRSHPLSRLNYWRRRAGGDHVYPLRVAVPPWRMAFGFGGVPSVARRRQRQRRSDLRFPLAALFYNNSFNLITVLT